MINTKEWRRCIAEGAVPSINTGMLLELLEAYDKVNTPDTLPCPFCGATAEWHERSMSSSREFGDGRTIYCNKCGSNGPRGMLTTHGKDALPSDAAAVAAWNTRPGRQT